MSCRYAYLYADRTELNLAVAHFRANGVAAMPILYRLVPDREEIT